MPQAWQKKKKRGKKLKIELPHDPTTPLLGICAELKPSFLSKWSVLSFPTYPLARSPCPSLYSHCPWAWVLRNHLLMGLNSPEQSESCRSPGISINKESLPPPTGHLGKGLHSHPVSSSCCLDSNENIPRAGSTAMILSNDYSVSDIAPGSFKTSCLNIQQSLNEAGVMLMYSYRKRKTQEKGKEKWSASNGQVWTLSQVPWPYGGAEQCPGERQRGRVRVGRQGRRTEWRAVEGSGNYSLCPSQGSSLPGFSCCPKTLL